jgi:outer membrane protein OmpA-like peptidoglycan-associated protein
MIDLLIHYGAFAAIAFLVGALVAFASRARAAEPDSLLRRSDHTIALWLCLAAAVAQVTLGRLSLYFDGALLLLVAFLAGFGATAAAFGPIARDRLAWRIGAGALALTCAAANMEAARSLESELRHRLGSLLALEGADPLNFELSGRDVFLPSDAPGRAILATRLERAGVRSVWTIDALSPSGAALRERVLAEEAARKAEGRAALAEWEKRQATLAAPAVVAPQERRSVADSHTAAKSRAPAAPAAPPGPLVWNPPRDPTLPSVATKEAEPQQPSEPPSCRAALATLAVAETIRFAEASAALDPDAQKRLVRFADLLKQCPQAVLEIRGHTDALGTAAKNRRLSLRRAQAVADYLGRAGVARERLVSAGLGDEKPTAEGETAAARAENRRVEFGLR